MTYYNITNVNSVSESNQLLTIQMSSMENWDHYLIHLQVDETVTYFCTWTYQCPLFLKLKKELKWLEEIEVIMPVDIAKDWNSWLIITTKNSGDIHMCIDLRHPERRTEVLSRLMNAKYFTKLDVAICFLVCSIEQQIPISQYISNRVWPILVTQALFWNLCNFQNI